MLCVVWSDVADEIAGGEAIMSHRRLASPELLFDADLAAPLTVRLGAHDVSYWCARCPGKAGPNEDSMAVVPVSGERSVVVVADGFGGQPAGDRASQVAVQTIVDRVCGVGGGGELREAILDGFEEANRQVLGMEVGAATTLAVVELEGETYRSYHVGDSEMLVIGQRGRYKYQTISHSPVGHGVEAGLISPDEAIHHEYRNLVSNMVGLSEMRIDIGPRLVFAPRDTLIVGSDGVFDNLSADEVGNCIRKGALPKVSGKLVDSIRGRMAVVDSHVPHKPDDVTFAVVRPAT